MALKNVAQTDKHAVFTALSTDTKPTGGEMIAGTQIWETDTGSVYRFDGTSWRLMVEVDSLGGMAQRVVLNPFVIWSTNDNAGPTLGYNAVGFNNNGVPAANVYVYDSANDTWRDTGQLVSGFFGL